jgi:uncharacterized membrane protein
MFGRSRSDAVKQNAAAAAELAAALARDPKFRKQLLAAAGHGARARQRAASRVGALAMLARLAGDVELREELQLMAQNLQAARARLEKKRSHTFRNTLMVVVGAGGAAYVASHRRTRSALGRVGGSEARVVQAEIVVDVPVSTAYNQWTQFEEFPRFMDGVEEVRQLDDTRLHWAARVGGVRAEWDAKILEQHPDSQISWVSEDGRKTRGTVSFEPLDDSRTLVRLSMSYRREGLREAAGAAAGLDTRRVRGDLARFKELIEGRGTESGAWRGDVSAGTATTAP